MLDEESVTASSNHGHILALAGGKCYAMLCISGIEHRTPSALHSSTVELNSLISLSIAGLHIVSIADASWPWIHLPIRVVNPLDIQDTSSFRAILQQDAFVDGAQQVGAHALHGSPSFLGWLLRQTCLSLGHELNVRTIRGNV